MDRQVLFAFGCVVFFIVAIGSYLYLMMSFAEVAEAGRDEPGAPVEPRGEKIPLP
jgi:hypothetical protein